MSDRSTARDDDPSLFYTGLVAELYDPLVSERARARDYLPFLERSGTPALELGCGTGRPLLELAALGYDVDGLDASPDMLARCREAAREQGLEVNLYHARMQDFALPRRYRSIFLAGASFTLLTSDAEARRALGCMRAHLLPGGSVLIPLETVDAAAVRAELGRFRETGGAGGTRLRCAVVAVDCSADGRDVARRLRYERRWPDGRVEVLERVWRTRSWPQAAFARLLDESGFESIRMRSRDGGPAASDAPVFVALARAGAAR
ncbi:MAG TPA: class I SAM-dependent methyltransferase [Pseudomonadales bacterium]